MRDDGYDHVEHAIRYIASNVRSQPSLTRIAAAVGLSEFHFQRLFRRWAGVSPKRFLQYLTAEYACGLLRESHTVLDTAYEAGLSGPGRLHDLTVKVHAVTPGEVRRAGTGLQIRYGVHPSPFGPCFVAQTDRGICVLGFADVDQVFEAERRRWPGATFLPDAAATRPVVERIFGGGDPRLALHVSGTNFQVRVWEALLRIPPGAAVTYGGLARALGMPSAARAVGTAVGQNPVSYLIPCHRVLRSTGGFGGYRWGVPRKMAILGWEAAQLQA